MNGVPHFGDFGKHHARTRAHQQVGREAKRRIGRDAGKGVGAAALEANDEIGGRAGFAAAPVEHGKPLVRHFHDGVDNGAKAVEGLVLHAHDAVGCLAWQQPFGNQLLAAEADNHDLAAEIRITRDVLQRPDRHDRQGRGDRNAAAVIMRQRDDVVDIGIFR
jgi:hypothetical protein